MALTSTSSSAAVRNQFLENCNYSTTATCELFIEACMAILSRPRRASAGQSGEEYEYDTKAISDQLVAARKWVRTKSRLNPKVYGNEFIRDL